ncbi:MAG: calcium/sodium antiporter, partial [Gammaproteobacteria bacterium]|nr:calcium/sodium antiporter [Gammaproteobacteria bacterium]
MIAAATVVLGLVLLIGGGTAMVHGASQAAIKLGWSPVVIGLTIVGFGTSAPELVVSLVAAAEGVSEIVFGNVIGSNICNIGLVLGLAALLAPLQIHDQLVRRELPLLLLGSAAILVMALDDFLFSTVPTINAIESIILLLLFAGFLYMTAIGLRNTRQTGSALRSDIEHSHIMDTATPSNYWWLTMAAGFALLFLGGKVTVDGSVALAELLGVSSAIIGLFVVAVGTSLPELVTSAVAAMRGESDLAVGNVVGSNIFNGLFVLPASGLISNVDVPEGGVADVLVSMAFAILLVS